MGRVRARVVLVEEEYVRMWDELYACVGVMSEVCY